MASREVMAASRVKHAELMRALSQPLAAAAYLALTPIQRSSVRTMVRVLMGDNEEHWPLHMRDQRVTAGGKFKGRPRCDKKVAE